MRIGLIAPPWIEVPPPGYGGTEAVVGNLARGLVRRGHDVELFTVGTSTCPVPRHHLFSHPVEPMGTTAPEVAHTLAAYEQLADADVIHDHTVVGPLIAGRVGVRSGPVVTTNHGPFNDVSTRIYREISRTAAVIAISADQARRAAGVPMVAVIHHGVDLEELAFSPHGGDRLVFIGRMSPDKGVVAAVRIARLAGRALVIVTKMREPAEREYYESQVRPELGRDAILVEEPPLGIRYELLANAAGLVNPIAWAEPFGLVMAEALAVGTPVIAFPRGAAPEIVTDGRTGFLCPDVESAVGAVSRLAEIDRLACRRDAERRFSLDRMAADHERVYEQLVREARRPDPAEPTTAGVTLAAPDVDQRQMSRKEPRHRGEPGRVARA
jgi:glycosyltransferase involved in cell wall biosynthesis